LILKSGDCDHLSQGIATVARTGNGVIMDVKSNGLPAENEGPNGAQRRLLDQEFVTNAISRSAENPSDRRRFMRRAGLAGLGVVATGACSAPARG
jgi:hypothetical protein